LRLAFWRKPSGEDREKNARAAAAAPEVAATASPGGGIRSLLRRMGATQHDWQALEEQLLAADVGLSTSRELVAAVRTGGEEDPLAALRAQVLALLAEPATIAPAPADAPVAEVVLLVGVNGAGKTTSAAKLAARARAAGATPLLVAADTFRAAAIDQLRLLAQREGVPISEGRAGGDPAAAIHDALTMAAARNLAPVIIDTAGRMQTRTSLMEELAKMRRVISRLAPGAAVEVLLVLDATAGQNGLAQARGFDAAAGVDGVVLTKMDAGARGGIALAVRRELGLPVRWLGVGEGTLDLVPFDAASFADGLLGDGGASAA